MKAAGPESRGRRARGRRHLDARGSQKLPRRRSQTAGRRISWRAHRNAAPAVIGRHRRAGFAQYPRRFPICMTWIPPRASISSSNPCRRAYRDRAIFLGDPDFIKMPLQQLMSVDTPAGQRSSIRADKAMPQTCCRASNRSRRVMNTTHFSVLDAAGNRAAVTITVNLFFGNGYIRRAHGVLLNNEMDDFSVKPGTPQCLRTHRQHWPTRSHPTSAACRACPPRSSRRQRA